MSFASFSFHSIEYWFRCMDLDGDGVLSMYELEYFYTEQITKMDVLGIETMLFEDCLCQVCQCILTELSGSIHLQLLCEFFVNLNNY